MGVANLTWDAAMVEAALFRSGGVDIDNYQYGPAPNPTGRNYVDTGTHVGHLYIHVQGGGDSTVGLNSGRADRSRFVDRPTAIAVIVEMLNSTEGKAALTRLDAVNAGDTSGDRATRYQEWVKKIPISGIWYGYRQHRNTRCKIVNATINMRSHGDALFISSAYPEDMQAAPARRRGRR